MGEIRFHTPEDVDVAYRPAGPGTRFLSVLIDQTLITLFMLVIAVGLILLGVVSDTFPSKLRKAVETDQQETLFWYVFAVIFLMKFVADIFYYTLFEIFMAGQTLGKKYTRIQVIQEGGFSLSPAASLVRNALRIVDNFPPCWVVLLLSPLHKRIGDYAARTLVISKMAVQRAGPRSPVPFYSELPFHQFEFTADQLSRLSDKDLELLESYFERRNRLEGEVRRRLRHTLSDSLRSRLEIPARSTFKKEERFLYELRSILHEQSVRRQI